MTSDQQFLRDVESGELPAAQFSHLAHVRYAYLCCREDGSDAARARMRKTLKRLTTKWNVKEKFHHTMTDGLVSLIAERAQSEESWDEAQSQLGDIIDDARGVLLRHYSEGQLEKGRSKSLPPDLRGFDGYCTIGQLAKLSELSRSTLLYYERLGLISCDRRTPAGYRLYGPESQERLRKLCLYRETGLSLKDARRLLEREDDDFASICHLRLDDISLDIRRLEKQRELLLELLGEPSQSLDKVTWCRMLEAAGMTESDMMRWHEAFEAERPEAHRQFLMGLGIDDEEIERIRRG